MKIVIASTWEFVRNVSLGPNIFQINSDDHLEPFAYINDD